MDNLFICQQRIFRRTMGDRHSSIRSYNSYAESFQDHANVIRSTAFGDTYHYSGVWKSNTSSYRDATAALAGSYATDPGYAEN